MEQSPVDALSPLSPASASLADASLTDATLRSVRQPRWSVFDADWYLATYPETADQMAARGIADVETFYNEIGRTLRHSPNMFFDEAFYLDTNPDVADHVSRGLCPSGFVHYLNDGHHDPARDPHWLFSEKFYLSQNPDVTKRVMDDLGLINGYDHFLAVGDGEFRTAHWFFDGMMYRNNKPEEDKSDPLVGGPFVQFLAGGGIAGTKARLSWYFDPDWYLATYPAVQKEIDSGRYDSALHHYLRNPKAPDFNPLEWFSEEFYGLTYPDVQGAVEDGVFRNCYEHFVKHGAAERRKPHADVDLLSYFLSGSVRADLEGGAYRDSFAHWIARRPPGGHGSEQEELIQERQTKQLFARAADSMLPQLARQPLDFTVAGTPKISVIVVLFNKFPLTMMALASLRANYAGSIELIVVDNKSSDETRNLERYVLGAKILHFRYNSGFVEACNTALQHVTGPAVLYLNNDLQIGMNAVALALRRLYSDPAVGAVGAKFVRTNGLLQEAGSIIWRDGSTFGYLRDADPNIPEANFVREVDFCSGAFLLVRTELVRMLKGFDEDYKPAYYEEADMCVRLRKAGYKIIYDPSIVIQHFEYGSASSAASTRLMLRNHKIFTQKHRDFLRYQHPPRLRNALFARSPRREEKRILFIEDRVPQRNLGAGYVRSNDIIHTMAALGHHVTVYPIYKSTNSVISIFRDFPETVEVVYDREMEQLHDFIEERAGYYDVVWIGRTHNLERLLPILGDVSSALPDHGFVLDTEAIAAPRNAERNRVFKIKAKETLEAALKRELECAYFCQKIIAVNDYDASLVRQAGYSNVAVLGHQKDLVATPNPFSERHGMLFLGAIHDAGSPNHDSLEWFISEVLPLLDGHLPPEVRFTIAGFINRSVDLSPFGRNPRVDLVGPVDDLSELYNSHRIFVAPTRFAGGIPFKVHEAASYGLPIVAMDLLVRQVGWQDGVEIMAGGTDDPQRFADRIVALYTDRSVWNQVRQSALRRLERENSRAHYRETLRTILDDVTGSSRPQAIAS